MKRLLPKLLLATLMLILYAVAASAEELRIDFENDLTYYAEWDFVNIGRQEEEGIAHGGRSYGTNNKNTSYITTKSAIANPQNITFFISKRNKATTTTASFWYLQISADGNSWENVQTVSATAMAIGEWKEITQDLTAFENVYIRIHYNGANSVRPIDDILLTTSAHEKKTAKPSLTPSDIYTSPTDITKKRNRADFWLAECNKQERIYKGLLTKSKNREVDLKQELLQRDNIIATMKAGLTDFLRGFTIICQNAINAVIDFAHDTKLQHFTFLQATAINEYLSKESSDRRNGATILALLTRPFLNLFEHKKGKAEIENVVDNFDYYKKKQKLQEETRIKLRFRR